MSQRHEVRSYDYVNQPYEKVRELLTADPAGVFRAATRAATSRAETLAAGLRINLGGIEVGTEIAVSIGEIEETRKATDSSRVVRIPVEWEAASRPRLFPLMNAVLSVYPLTATETQLDFHGRYEPPLGALGSVIDKVAGHKLAEASTHRFVADIAGYLRQEGSREQTARA